jgi:hypothetical protein
MKATTLYGPGDLRVKNQPDPMILKPTDAIIRIPAASVCGQTVGLLRHQLGACAEANRFTSTAERSKGRRRGHHDQAGRLRHRLLLRLRQHPISLNRHPRHECVWSSLLLSRAGEI